MIAGIFTAGCAALLLLSSPGGERIEARVNEEILTTSELNRMLAPVYRQYEASFRGRQLEREKEQARRAAIRGWIENQLILQEARALQDFRIDRMEVERMLEEERRKFESPEEFERALVQEGLTEKEYREILADRYKVRALTFQRVTGLISISPRRIKEYYRENQDRYREGEMARISLILIPAGVSEEQRAAARELADSLVEKLDDGADFAELARRHSEGPRAEEGGDFGFIERGRWRARLEEAAFQLEVGEHSGVIETEEGYYILHCAGRREASLTPLEEVWERIDDELYREEYRRRYEAWIEDLKSRSHVVVGDDG